MASVLAGLTAYIMCSFLIGRGNFYGLKKNMQSVSCLDGREEHFIHLSFTLHTAVVQCSSSYM